MSYFPFSFYYNHGTASIFIKNSTIAPLEVLGQTIIISQFADDTSFFMKQLLEVPKILQSIYTFSKASGLKINMNKCELMPIHQCHLTEAYNISIQSTVKYLE